MNNFANIFVGAIVLASSTVEAYSPAHNKFSWETAFQTDSCNGCTAKHGVLLPWCAKLPVSSLVYPPQYPGATNTIPLPPCVRVSTDCFSSQLIYLSSVLWYMQGYPAGNLAAGQLNGGVLVDATQVQCSSNASIPLPSCIALNNMTLPNADFGPSSVLNSTIPLQNSTCQCMKCCRSINCETINLRDDHLSFFAPYYVICTKLVWNF